MSNSHLKRLFLLKGLASRLALGLVAMLTTIAIQLYYPKALSHFIDNIDAAMASGWLSDYAVVMLVLLTLQAGAAALRYYLFESAGLLVVAKVRTLLHQSLLCQPIAFFDQHNVGEMTNRLNADTEVLHDTLTMGLAISLRSLCICIGGLIMLLSISPMLCLGLLFFIPTSMFLGRWLGQRIRLRSQAIQDCQAECGRVAHENFANARLVHAFNQWSLAQQHYQQATDKALHSSLSCTGFLAMFNGLASFLMFMALLFTLWLGGSLISQGMLTVGELTSFVIYAAMVASSAEAVSGFWSDWMRTLGATDRIFSIIDDSSVPAKVSQTPLCLQGHIVIEHLSFSYPQRPQNLALSNFNLTIQPGEKIALVGPSGAGKSTLANLLLGFYQPNSGRILLDGQPLAALNLADVRSQMAIVEQEPSLFWGSLYDNIAFAVPGGRPSQAEVEAAARQANAHDFILNFPDGYHTMVGDRGVQLSGGQKQRIAIARALLRNPRILILDEATSALDGDSEKLVQDALDRLMAGRTTIMIAHRLSTIVKANRVVVIDRGELVEYGSHRELSQKADTLYRRLMHSQKLECDAPA
ncbi:ABC transporter ATP-binding protein [Bowmanella denitrificans]|uniref:ABC transporter ATP-binding protein n=1 Tax=Bowmanella denitrificans TaxID=366582 RepID=UPI000C9A56CF|nr:ABC transporter transmembrane domain-containing protein [Bowmanella denitrificans]